MKAVFGEAERMRGDRSRRGARIDVIGESIRAKFCSLVPVLFLERKKLLLIYEAETNFIEGKKARL